MGLPAQSARAAVGLGPYLVPSSSSAGQPDEAKAAPLPASPSSIPSGLVVCNASQEALQGDEVGLKLLDICPVCQVAVARHRFLPPTAATTTPAVVSSPSASVRSAAQLGKSTILPLWGAEHGNIHARPFLESIGYKLLADSVDPKVWPRLLLKAVPNVHDCSWVKLNIVDPGVDWDKAKELFTAQFEVATWTEQSQELYANCRQGPKQSVQQYAHQFMAHVAELGYQDNDEHVILHFRLGLISSLQGKIRDRVHMYRDLQQKLLTVASPGSLSSTVTSTAYEIRSLKELIDLAISIERSAQVSSSLAATSSVSTPTPSPSTSGGSASTSSGAKKSCIHHPNSNSHNTADCKFPGTQSNARASRSVTGSSSAGGSSTSGSISAAIPAVVVNKQGEIVRCYSCNGNHYANDKNCPMRSDRVTRSAVAGARASGSSPSPSSTRPQLATQSGALPSGTPSVPAPIRNSAVTVPSYAAASSGVSVPPAVVLASASLPSVHSNGPLTATAVIPTQHTVYLMVKGRVYSSLTDSGAERSFVDSALVSSLSVPITPPVPGSKIRLAHADIFTDRSGSVNLDATAIFLGCDRDAVSFRCQFEIMPIHGVGNDHHFIIGRDLIRVLFPHGIPLSYLPQETSDSSVVAVVASSTLVDSLAVSSDASMLGSMPTDDLPDRIQLSTPEQLEAQYAAPRQHLLQTLSPLLATNAAITGFCNVPEAVVRLEVDPADTTRLWRTQYRIAETLRAAATVIINRWFSEGKIVLAPPGCPYNNPITVAPKKDEHGMLTGARPCLDVRALNQVLKSNDRFLIPHIRSLLDSFAGNSIFSEFDLQEAYLQFPLDPESQPFTAFTWDRQQFMFAGCPYGISLLTSFFQRIMTRIFGDLPFCSPYVDNLPFAANDWETHLQQAALIVERCNQVNLKIKPKFNLGHAQLKCLGHVLSFNGIAADPDKLAVVRDWPLPATGKQLQSFLGLCSFLRQHVRHYAELTAPLEDVKLDSTIQWNDVLRTSFDVVKDALLRSPVLSFPDFTRPFHIATDASQTGVGGVLFQPRSADEHITPTNIVALVSKKLQPTQQCWPAYRKELWGIVYCLRRFHAYIWGRTDLVLHTDHKPLTHMFSSAELSHPLQQWLDTILDYQFVIVHRDGILNVIPDAISRMFQAAYATAPVWGVDGSLTTAPLQLSATQLVGERAADQSAGQPQAQPDDTQIPLSAAAPSSDLIVELERRGKRCPSSDDERSELIKDAHALGHFGREAIFRRLFNDGFWWPDMRNEIQEELNNCDVCTRFVVVKSGFHPAEFITAPGPLHHVQVDTSTHLPESPEGCTALLVCIDVFTGYLLLRAVKDTTAVTIAQQLWEIFSILGFPKILQSDNGPEYVSDIIRALLQLTGMEQRLISPYNPRADGKVERAIGVVVMIIKKLLHGTSKHWPLFVPFAQFSYNSKVSSLTASSPFALMFAREPNALCDHTGEEPVQVNLNDWNDYQRKVISVIYPAVSDRIMTRKLQQSDQIDRTHRLISPQTFPAGATVMIKDPVRGNKFEPTYIGPYTVLRRSRGGAYVLKDATGDLLDRHVPADKMKLIARRRRRRIDTDKPAFEVQKILEHRGSPGSYEYLVHWKGLDQPTDHTWEPAVSFLDHHVIESYWRSKA